VGHTLKDDLGPKRDTEASAAVSEERKNKNKTRKRFFFRMNYKLYLRGPEVFKAPVTSQSFI